MKRIAIVLLGLLLLSAIAAAVSLPYTFNGKPYYIVSSANASEDTGDEVCAKVGMECVGYSIETEDVCKYFHPSAAVSSSLDGDFSGVYCDGLPQTGVCSGKINTCHNCPACTNTVDCSTPIGNLYREMFVECKPKVSKGFLEDIFDAIRAFFSQMSTGFFSLFSAQPIITQPIITQPIFQRQVITQTVSVQIGPYPGMWACEFLQIPFPGVNKKLVSCPYETPGAAINDAANAFCRNAMSSSLAEAAMCSEQGVIVCVHPCETEVPYIMPTRCAFDIDRPRGNQAEPLNWCPPKQPTPVPPSGAGRPDNCFDTAYQAHPGYNSNQAFWDGYTADTDGVCQSEYGRGVPSPCAHIVQISYRGNPYYICWYNN